MGQIIIQKLIIQGVSYRRTIHFNEGLTIISGEKTSGKSLILSLIDYCLGKSSKIDLTVQTELDTYCDQVFLQLKIDGEILTFRRLLKERQGKISIYFCAFEILDEYTPKTLDVKDAMQLVMQKLNINEYKLIRHKKHSLKKELERVSFRDIFRYVYIHQHALGTGDFLEEKDKSKSYKNPSAFKMMFNLVDVDKDTLNEQLVEVQNGIEETRREISGLNSYLKDKSAEDRAYLQARSDKFNKEIDTQKQAKADIIQNSKSNSNKENSMYIKLKKDLELISNELFDYRRQKRDLQISISSKRLLLEEYKIEQSEIEETLNINYKLIIPDQNIECPLCNSRVSHHTHEQVHQDRDTEKMLHKVKREIVNKIKLVSNLIDVEMSKIDEIEKEMARLSEKQSVFNEAISEFAKKTDVPFLSQIDSINSIINRLIKEQEMIKEGLRIHNKINEKEKHIKGLESSEDSLKKKISALQISDKDRKEIFEFLNREYKNFMNRFKYDTSVGTFIHPDLYIPFYNGASVYAHESGGLLECMQLSYLGAILKSKTQGYATGHPGVLLLDSLSKYVGTLKKEDKKTDEVDENQSSKHLQNSKDEKGKINDPEVYEEFYNILIELSSNYQIILVENTPPEKFDKKYTKYTFLNGKKGLINRDANELEDNI